MSQLCCINLNTSKVMVRFRDLHHTNKAEMTWDQGVTGSKDPRSTWEWHSYILSFNIPKYHNPSKLVRYIRLIVEAYIPNPLRCFSRWWYGHHQVGQRDAHFGKRNEIRHLRLVRSMSFPDAREIAEASTVGPLFGTTFADATRVANPASTRFVAVQTD